eukprot:maker-scaffold_1-snap-gene-1.30-mRNA-1 protein AED:0.35 eAED:0.38 QI:135/0.28/0.25/1/0.42/0.25/8/0/1566
MYSENVDEKVKKKEYNEPFLRTFTGLPWRDYETRPVKSEFHLTYPEEGFESEEADDDFYESASSLFVNMVEWREVKKVSFVGVDMPRIRENICLGINVWKNMDSLSFIRCKNYANTKIDLEEGEKSLNARVALSAAFVKHNSVLRNAELTWKDFYYMGCGNIPEENKTENDDGEIGVGLVRLIEDIVRETPKLMRLVINPGSYELDQEKMNTVKEILINAKNLSLVEICYEHDFYAQLEHVKENFDILYRKLAAVTLKKPLNLAEGVVCIVGSKGVGKTSLLKKLMGDEFSEKERPTKFLSADNIMQFDFDVQKGLGRATKEHINTERQRSLKRLDLLNVAELDYSFEAVPHKHYDELKKNNNVLNVLRRDEVGGMYGRYIGRGKQFINFFDFSGDEKYCLDNQMFFPRETVFLVVFNTEDVKNVEKMTELKDWCLRIIRHRANAPMLLIGTHCSASEGKSLKQHIEKVSEFLIDEFDDLWDQLALIKDEERGQCFWPIENCDDSGVRELQMSLMEFCFGQIELLDRAKINHLVTPEVIFACEELENTHMYFEKSSVAEKTSVESEQLEDSLTNLSNTGSFMYWRDSSVNDSNKNFAVYPINLLSKYIHDLGNQKEDQFPKYFLNSVVGFYDFVEQRFLRDITPKLKLLIEPKENSSTYIFSRPFRNAELNELHKLPISGLKKIGRFDFFYDISLDYFYKMALAFFTQLNVENPPSFFSNGVIIEYNHGSRLALLYNKNTDNPYIWVLLNKRANEDDIENMHYICKNVNEAVNERKLYFSTEELEIETCEFLDMEEIAEQEDQDKRKYAYDSSETVTEADLEKTYDIFLSYNRGERASFVEEFNRIEKALKEEKPSLRITSLERQNPKLTTKEDQLIKRCKYFIVFLSREFNKETESVNGMHHGEVDIFASSPYKVLFLICDKSLKDKNIWSHKLNFQLRNAEMKDFFRTPDNNLQEDIKTIISGYHQTIKGDKLSLLDKEYSTYVSDISKLVDKNAKLVIEADLEGLESLKTDILKYCEGHAKSLKSQNVIVEDSIDDELVSKKKKVLIQFEELADALDQTKKLFEEELNEKLKTIMQSFEEAYTRLKKDIEKKTNPSIDESKRDIDGADSCIKEMADLRLNLLKDAKSIILKIVEKKQIEHKEVTSTFAKFGLTFLETKVLLPSEWLDFFLEFEKRRAIQDIKKESLEAKRVVLGTSTTLIDTFFTTVTEHLRSYSGKYEVRDLVTALEKILYHPTRTRIEDEIKKISDKKTKYLQEQEEILENAEKMLEAEQQLFEDAVLEEVNKAKQQNCDESSKVEDIVKEYVKYCENKRAKAKKTAIDKLSTEFKNTIIPALKELRANFEESVFDLLDKNMGGRVNRLLLAPVRKDDWRNSSFILNTRVAFVRDTAIKELLERIRRRYASIFKHGFEQKEQELKHCLDQPKISKSKPNASETEESKTRVNRRHNKFKEIFDVHILEVEKIAAETAQQLREKLGNAIKNINSLATKFEGKKNCNLDNFEKKLDILRTSTEEEVKKGYNILEDDTSASEVLKQVDEVVDRFTGALKEAVNMLNKPQVDEQLQ